MRERVTGIGGLFFPARDPEALGAWYAEHLGVAPPPDSYDDPSWWQERGPTVFAPSSSGRTGHTVNFRVRDLDAMVAQLAAAGIAAAVDPERYPNGRFARLEDPEGNPVELWEPAGTDARDPAA